MTRPILSGTTLRTSVSRRRSAAFIPVALGALLGALGTVSVSAAPPTGTDASEVSHWNQVAATTLIAFPPPDGGSPVAFQINMGMVQGAVYDAVNAIGPKKHRAYLLDERTGAKASIDAAVATAAYDVLANLVTTAPERVPFPGRAGLLTNLSTEYGTSLGAVADNAFKMQGVAVGHLAAEGHDRRADGRRAVRAVSMEPGDRPRKVAAAPQFLWGTDPRPDPMGGRRDAVPHPELVAVPQRATA